MDRATENAWDAWADDAGRWVDEAGEKLAALVEAHRMTSPKGKPVPRHYLESLLTALVAQFEDLGYQLAPSDPDQSAGWRLTYTGPADDAGNGLAQFPIELLCRRADVEFMDELRDMLHGLERGAVLSSGADRLARSVTKWHRAAREKRNRDTVDVLVDADIRAQASVDLAMLRDPGVRSEHVAGAATTAHLVGDPELSAFFDGVAVAMAAGSR